MLNEEKNYDPIIFMNMPITNKEDDVIGISTSVKAINNAIEDGAEMIGIIAEYGTGKSSLTEMLMESDVNNKEIKINMWNTLDKNDDERKGTLTKTFIYQLAEGINQGVANHVNKILSRNYGILSFSIGLKRFWLFLVAALLFVSIYFMLDNINMETYIEVLGIKLEAMYAIKFFSPICIVISLICAAVGLINTNIAFSKWKDENSRITEINELFYAYSYVYKQLLDKKKQTIVVIEDLDRIEDKSLVVEFLKELYRFNNLFNYKKKKKRPVFIVSIAPESCLKEVASEVRVAYKGNEEVGKKPKKSNIYSKIFDYVIELKPIHYDDYEIVLRDIINSESDKRTRLNELLDIEPENDKLPKEFKWIYKGENLTIREIKDRLNKSIALFIDLKNKKYISNPYIDLEACCAVVYLEAEYPVEFYLITHKERELSELIQVSYSSGVTWELIAEKLETKEINEELCGLIKNRILDTDFKMYFYSFPKGSYIKNIDEKQVCNNIELPNDNEYKVEELNDQVERIYADGKKNTLKESIEKVCERGQLFPKIIFENRKLFELTLQIDKENLIKSLDSIMKYNGDKLNGEDIRVLTNVKKYCDKHKEFFEDFIENILKQSDNLSIDEIVNRRILLIHIFRDNINLVESMFINSSHQMPIITEGEIKEINDVNKTVNFVDIDYIDSENYSYIQDMLLEGVFIESNKAEAVAIQEAITEIVDIEYIKDDVYNFMNNNKIVHDTLFVVLSALVIQGDLEKNKIVEYINNLPIEKLTDLYFDQINCLSVCSGLKDEIISKLIEKQLYETPLLQYCESDKLQKINLVDKEQSTRIILACENINKIDACYVPNIRVEIIVQNNGEIPDFYTELYSEKYELISNQEIYQMNEFEIGFRWISGNRISDNNLERILECINVDKRQGEECFIIFDYLFNKEYDDVCSDNEVIRKIIYGIDYTKVAFNSMTKEQVSKVITMLTVPLKLNTAEEAKKFMLLVNYLDEELEKEVYSKINIDEYIDFINQFNMYSEFTIQIIESLSPSYSFNSNIRERLLMDKCYKHYIVGKILYEGKFEFPMKEVPVEEIVLLYREESQIIDYLINSDLFINYVYNKNLFNYMGNCTFEMVQPFQKFKQTFEIMEFVLVCLKPSEDVDRYLLELNEIADPNSSVRISKLLIKEQYIHHLTRDDVFENVKFRLWENVSKNKGYKGVFTRKRNEYVKNPVQPKIVQKNILYPYVK